MIWTNLDCVNNLYIICKQLRLAEMLFTTFVLRVVIFFCQTQESNPRKGLRIDTADPSISNFGLGCGLGLEKKLKMYRALLIIDQVHPKMPKNELIQEF